MLSIGTHLNVNHRASCAIELPFSVSDSSVSHSKWQANKLSVQICSFVSILAISSMNAQAITSMLETILKNPDEIIFHFLETCTFKISHAISSNISLTVRLELFSTDSS